MLSVISAGNDGNQIDSEADADTCGLSNTDSLVVGSYDIERKLSEFSNYGRCVNIYSLGSDVVIAAPDDFFSMASGTSFSAPLVSRYLSMNYAAGTTVDQMRSAAIAAADASGYLPAATYPKELAWVREASPSISTYTLIADHLQARAKTLPDENKIKRDEKLRRFVRDNLRGFFRH